MIPSFVPFQTASRALAASMTAITVTGNNISNANTENYTRQKVDLSSISSSTFTEKYTTGVEQPGQGVSVDGISQYRDSFLDARYRTQNSTSNQYSTFLSGLQDTLSVIDEAETDGLMSQLSDFQSQLQKYSQTATSDNLALVARTSAESTAEMMNVYSEQISGVRDQAISDLSNIVVANTFNSTVKGIASLNKAIRDQEISGGTPNELYDQRNALIDTLSGVAGIQVKVTNEKVNDDISVDNISISLYNSQTGNYDISVVDGSQYNTLSVSESDDTYGAVSVTMNSSYGTNNGKDITDSFSSGSIKGYLDLINGAGSYAATGENGASGTLYYLKSLDTLASNFADVFNKLNDLDTAAGNDNIMTSTTGLSVSNVVNTATTAVSVSNADNTYTLDFGTDITATDTESFKLTLGSNTYNVSLAATGTGVKDSIDTNGNISLNLNLGVADLGERLAKLINDDSSTDQDLFTSSDGSTITAANIQVSDAWLDDPTYINTTTASATSGSGDNILKMVTAMQSDTTFTDPSDPASVKFKGSFNEYASALVGELSLEVNLNQNFSDTATTVLSTLSDDREQISGATLDEEGVNLIVYQKAYEAAARYFTALDEAMDTIINRMGVVGL